jgi:3-hydroxyisobutyrate dehydrogenase
MTTITTPLPQAAHTHAPQAPGAPRVAVIGTGTMGAAMARNLLRADLTVDVWNRTPGRIRPLARAGAVTHPDPAQAVAAADVVLTMLPDADTVKSVAMGDGLLAAMRPGAVWVQMGTIGVPATDELTALIRERRPDVLFADAPVSGTRRPAEAGELTILASGPQQARARLEPVFAAIGSRTFWLGPAGAGSRMKLVLNTWLAFLVEGIAETAALADALEVSHEDLGDALAGGPLGAGLALAKLAKIDTGDETPDFALRWALKDVDLAMAVSGGSRLPVTAAISRQWHELADAGLADKDVSAVRSGLGSAALIP